jgi:hypothetical protein
MPDVLTITPARTGDGLIKLSPEQGEALSAIADWLGRLRFSGNEHPSGPYFVLSGSAGRPQF